MKKLQLLFTLILSFVINEVTAQEKEEHDNPRLAEEFEFEKTKIPSHWKNTSWTAICCYEQNRK